MSNRESKPQKKKRLYTRWWFILLLCLFSVVIGDIVVVAATYGESKSIDVQFVESNQPVPAHVPAENITLMSLNLAHGRSDGPNQMFVDNEVIKQNIQQVAELLTQHRPDAVALQEADAPSWWSGGFSHTTSLAKQSGLHFVAQAHNVDGLGLHYGTAIIGSLPTNDKAKSHTFERSFPTFSKGCVITTCQWPGDPKFEFDLISVHLDFAKSSTRASQLNELTNLIKQHHRPVIIMGDFNSEAGDLLRSFKETNNLSTWNWDSQDIITFPTLDSRIDWFFVSEEFKITEHSVLDDVISDHRAIKAKIKRRDSSTL